MSFHVRIKQKSVLWCVQTVKANIKCSTMFDRQTIKHCLPNMWNLIVKQNILTLGHLRNIALKKFLLAASKSDRSPKSHKIASQPELLSNAFEKLKKHFMFLSNKELFGDVFKQSKNVFGKQRVWQAKIKCSTMFDRQTIKHCLSNMWNLIVNQTKYFELWPFEKQCLLKIFACSKQKMCLKNIAQKIKIENSRLLRKPLFCLLTLVKHLFQLAESSYIALSRKFQMFAKQCLVVRQGLDWPHAS